MKKYLVFLAAALLQAGAWAVTYTYTGSTYTAPTLTNHAGPGCPIGACGDFTTSMSQYGTFTTVSPLPPNFNGNIAPLITGFNFNDGLTTYSSVDPNTTLTSAIGWTDASGALVGAGLNFQRWHTSAPHSIGDRVDQMVLEQGAYRNSPCNVVTTPPGGDVCNAVSFDASSSNVFGVPSASGTWTAIGIPPMGGVTSVPTLSEWGLMMLACLLAALGLRQRRKL